MLAEGRVVTTKKGFLVLSDAKPIEFSMNEGAAKEAALLYLDPDRKRHHRWTANGKLFFLGQGFKWLWTGWEVLPLKIVGESPNASSSIR